MLKKIKYFSLMLLFVAIGCKTSRFTVKGEVDSSLSTRNVIKSHYTNELNFKTLTGRMQVDFNDGNSEQGATLTMRMEKDKAIWLSATLGMVKVYITPEHVSFYNKMDKTYFDGDFSYLSHLLGLELNFEKVQNLLLGQAVFNLNKESCVLESNSEAYELKAQNQASVLSKIFLVDPGHFKLRSQQFIKDSEDKSLLVWYRSYQEVGNKIVPEAFRILAQENDKQLIIDIQYKNIQLNDKVYFPYRMPNGYKEL